MNRLITNRVAILLCASLILLLGVPFVQAQGANLLSNPGFEQPYATIAGTPPRQVAQGWTPWHVPASEGMSSSENVQPEYYPSSDLANILGVPRVRSGAESQQYHSFFATHIGGVYQRVTGITPGAQLRFSVFAYVWSSTYDEVDLSEQDGGVLVQVGIDPQGGTDGQSPTIVWSSPMPRYDSFNEYSVTASATADAVTVFVRSTVGFPVKNNAISLDDASLTVVGGTSPTTAPTNTTVPPTATTVAPTNTTVPPTNTSVPPTNTTVPPTSEGATLVPPTSVPPTDVPPTNTTVPPTATTVPPTQPPAASPTPEVVGPTAIPASPTPRPTIDPGMFPGTIVHIVQSGDTVQRLAMLYGSSIDAIISANGLNNSGLIFVGQSLIIPVRLAPPSTPVPGAPTATSVPPVTMVVTPTQQPPTAVPSGGTTTYVVRYGDTLGVIALRFNTTIAALRQLNGIVNPNLIYAGQRLVVPTGGSQPDLGPLPTAIILPVTVVVATPSQVPPPPTAVATFPPSPQPTTYLVQRGDTLYSISLRFNVPLARLIQVNGLLDPNRIFVGQVIVIP